MPYPHHETVDIADDKPFRDESSEDSESSSMLASPFHSSSPTTPTKQRKGMAWLNLTILCANVIFVGYNVLYSWQSITWIKFQKHYCPDQPFCESHSIIFPFPPRVLEEGKKKSDQSDNDTGIKYENTVMHLENSHNPFARDLGPAVDKIWDDLLNWSNIRLSKDEMRQAGELANDSVTLADGEGYVGTLRVFHELYCMSWIKCEYSNVSRSFEAMDPTSASGRYREEHFDHCLNIMIQGVLCRSDLTTSSWWLALPLINRKKAYHTCVNWDSVEERIRPRLLSPDAKTITPSKEEFSIEELLRPAKPT
ncbi:hypothetical protein N7520_002897 [Penicillium odoratum]|uniref:uncharacterized protein n=1 Tax=Penicillium odoratum TaxID=1167516 RepID=UPI002546C615|nr:uncharacterized protein N7520_002897 [Penicillium odoratum]KAJ5772368.1 hypothetical protein N7520_002897 [Penicillium odoratum]